MDEDRDGKVTIDEFVGACMKQVKVSLPNDARAPEQKREGGKWSGAHPTEETGTGLSHLVTGEHSPNETTVLDCSLQPGRLVMGLNAV